ncbi:MAG: 16S rRNA (uracil(1498)-N(3))-methyltransferase [Pseudomonadota bacterium]
MRIPRLYHESRLHSGDVVSLHQQAVHYVLHVLRLKKNAELILFNGRGGEFTARIIDIERHKVLVKIDQFLSKGSESPLEITLLHAIAKGERMDWVMQKSTELGARKIIPIITNRCNIRFNRDNRSKKQAHWQAIVNHACEQCGRNRIPVVTMPIDFSEAVTTDQAELKLVLHHQATEKISRLQTSEQPKRISLLIGSEGGLNATEIDLARQHHYRAVQFGCRILRTETAALTALACLQLRWGDF